VTPPSFSGYVPTAHRYDYGTQNSALYDGIGAAVDFLSGIGMENIRTRACGLASHLQQRLIELGGQIEMVTPTEERSRGAIIGFRLKKMPLVQFGDTAQRHGFRIRLVKESKIDIVRVSTHIYNSMDEIDRFAQFVKETA
jgi:L-cysteine/cystine lyase